MSRVYEPSICIHVIASSPHPPKTEYRVSRGYEKWEQKVAVTKIQMVYDGKVAGKIAPSIPENTNDLPAILFAIKLLHQGWGVHSKTKRCVVMVKKNSPHQTVGELSEQAQNEIHDFYTELYPPMTLVDVIERHREPLENDLMAFVFDVNIGLTSDPT